MLWLSGFAGADGLEFQLFVFLSPDINFISFSYTDFIGPQMQPAAPVTVVIIGRTEIIKLLNLRFDVGSCVS